MALQLAEQYHREIEARPARYLLGPQYRDIHAFLSAPIHKIDPLEVLHKSPIGERFDREIRRNLSPDLAGRAEQVFSAVLALRDWRIRLDEDGLQIPDADTIQQWVLQLIKPDEFPMFVPPAFKGWADRLTDDRQQVPHIAQANQFIAERIAQHFNGNGLKKVRGVDLGSGTGATMLNVMDTLQREGIENDISGVDLTPSLAAKAMVRTGKQVDTGNALEWLEKQADGSLDYITMVYAIHHLSYEDQFKLQELARKKLKKGGIFAIADPTGRSPFNLQNLDVNEPEAVMACFRPDVEDVVESFEGFHVNTTQGYKDENKVESFGVTSTVKGDVLDQGTLGYAVLATRMI